MSPLWLIHIARDWDRERDKHNRRQSVLVPFPVSDQCEHFCTIYWNPLIPCTCPGPGPGPVQCECAITPALLGWGTCKPEDDPGI